MVQPLIIRGAQIWDAKSAAWWDKDAIRHNLYTDGERIAAQPVPGALTVDLEGYTIFPGLINAHDHLELNHYPRSKFREKYNNAHKWGEDMNARLNDEPYKSLRAYPLDDRCFIGGLKNLLCGATTVAHHNPPHKCLFRKDFPVRVLKNYGWAHSLHFNTEEEIIQSYRSTPKDWPWFIHLAEGTDEVAAGEYQRLKALGCVGKNTVIVHGVGLTKEDTEDAVGLPIRGRVICPTTNRYLLGETPDLDWWNEAVNFHTFQYGANIAPGSDSRLTADSDLLNDLHAGVHFYPLPTGAFSAAHLLGIQDHAGHLSVNTLPDFIVIYTTNREYPIMNFGEITRSQIKMVVKGGVPQLGDPEVMVKFPHIQTVGATLDGKPKAIHIDLARRIHQCSLKERGLEVEALPRRIFGLRQ
jgi:hypothetical protein